MSAENADWSKTDIIANNFLIDGVLYQEILTVIMYVC